MVTRTVVFPIYPTKAQKEALHETLELYCQAVKSCIDVAWDMEKLSAVDVHKETYRKLKEELGLGSQYLCSARNKAVENVRGIRILRKKGKKVSKPKVMQVPIRLDGRTLSFDKEREVASVATQHGRIKIPLIWHKHAMRYREWNCKAGEIGLDRRGRWVLRLVFETEIIKPKKTNNVIGVDRGIRHSLVSSNNEFFGEAKWQEYERKTRLHISRLQSKGTRSARRKLKKVFGRLRRFREDCDRVVAKKLFGDISPGDIIVLEKLTDIRDRCGRKGKVRKKHRAKMGRWSFKRVEDAIKYYAELAGVYVEYVEPHYTSQMCSKCGITLKKNRKNQNFYSCSCGCKLNADLNAARNIVNKWRMTNGYTPGLSVNQPIVANS